jgi:hypothetical protein
MDYSIIGRNPRTRISSIFHFLGHLTEHHH